MDNQNLTKCDLEHHLSRAEIFYKQDDISGAVNSAKTALACCKDKNKEVALKIFIARCLTKQGKLEESNKLYRDLIDEGVYLAPVMLGLMHNNLSAKKDEKVNKNMKMVKIFIGNE